MVASQQKTLKVTLPLHQLHATENPDQPTQTHTSFTRAWQKLIFLLTSNLRRSAEAGSGYSSAIPHLVVLVGLGVHVQSCLTLYGPMDSNLPGSSVYGTSQARILEWNTRISYSRGSS